MKAPNNIEKLYCTTSNVFRTATDRGGWFYQKFFVKLFIFMDDFSEHEAIHLVIAIP